MLNHALHARSEITIRLRAHMTTQVFHASCSWYHHPFTVSWFFRTQPPSSLALPFLLLLHLQQQGTIDMRKHASEGDGRTDQGVQFFITANSKL